MDGGDDSPGSERAEAHAARADAAAAEAYAEREALREQLRIATAEAAGAIAEREALQTQLRDAAAVSAALQVQLTEASERERAGASRFRDVILELEPAFPADLIAGDSIDAVAQSLGAAREIVGRVRAQIEEQAQSTRVPAGAPPRAAPDLSAMTPEEKIRFGLARRGGLSPEGAVGVAEGRGG